MMEEWINREAWRRGWYAVRLERCAHVNELLSWISGMGRGFFADGGHGDPRVDCFEVDERGRIWFRSVWLDRRIYTHHRRWRGFHHGGTLLDLCKDLARHIQTGDPLTKGLGPWPDWYCDGDPWDYGKDAMHSIRHKAAELGIYQARQEVQRCSVR